jgi:hypothetical protein
MALNKYNMDYLAAEFEFDFDPSIMEEELLAIPESEWLMSVNNGYQYKSLFLTVNDYQVFTDFKTAKTIKHSDWRWNPSLNIPYTKSIVDLLPKKQLGMVRAMWTNGPLPMHVDSNDTTPDDLTYSFGITLAPVLHEPMTMLKDTLVYGKAVIFDDSKPHGFPEAKTNQLGIRIFGDFLYEKFRILRTY